MNLLLLATLLFQAPAQGSFESLLEQATQLSPAAILTEADKYLPPEEAEWLTQAETQLPALPPKSQLMLGRILARADFPLGGPTLVKLLDEGPLLAQAALSTLSLGAFRNHEPTLAELGAWLAGPGLHAASALRAEAACSLHQIGDGVRRRAAQRILRDGLLSDDPATRRHSSLALARTGNLDDPQVLVELEAVSAGMGVDAALARSLIETYQQQQRYRRKLAALDRVLEQKLGESGATDSGDLAVLEEVIRHVQMRHMEGERFSREELVAAAADGLLGRLDPHSDFLTGSDFGEFIFDMNPEYGGIGAYVNVVEGIFTITRPIYSGPAYEAGLLTGDKIVEVDGWSTLDQPMDETIRRLKGKPGTEVTALVHRRGWTEPRPIQITRRKIEIPSLFTEVFPGGILYLDLTSFSKDCAVDILDEIDSFPEASALNGVVLDLRGNPGGYLSEAVGVCDLFLPKEQLIVTTRSRTGRPDRYQTKHSPSVDPALPVMVLVDRFSASASEIVSGALSIHERALVIGERTHGKGSVQNLLRLETLSDESWKDGNRNGKPDPWEEFSDHNNNGEFDFGPRIKLTMAYYFLPDGSTIHTQRDHEGRVVENGGVQPDIEVLFPELAIPTLRELDRLASEEKFLIYAKDLLSSSPELAVRLAEFDGGSLQAYPDWDDFYSSLETTLEQDEVRRWVRRRLRSVVADARGQVFAGSGFLGDYEEDPQLQLAIQKIFEQRGLTIEEVPEYSAVF
ncbi:MAG: S41 family peptidase [Planctomycetota bacterium]|jgi:carboxyl-terminal processing protease|nr:S41 family peptidase [Planctomycetota bacterium]MDP6941718.1 S41 family peptidase [Planctomycetota bacterium]